MKTENNDLPEKYDVEGIMIKVSLVSVFANIALTVFKLVAGILGQSSAMVADAIHSLSDVVGSGLVIVGAKISNRASDKGHPYGHERLECTVSIVLANILFVVAAGIGYSGVMALLDPGSLPVPGVLALVAAVVSIIVKEILFWYTWIAAKHTNSGSLRAEAWDHRSDTLSSLGSFAGILGAMLGIAVLQPVASIFISVLIFKAAIDIYLDTFNQLVDRACEPEFQERLRKVILAVPGVIDLDDMKTRLFGSKIYVDLEVACDGELKLRDAHRIAENVHHTLERDFPEIKHCTVHVNPR